MLFSWRVRAVGDAAAAPEAPRAGEKEKDARSGEKGPRAGEKRLAGDMPAKRALNASDWRRLGEAAKHAGRCGLRPCSRARPHEAGERAAASGTR